MIPGRVSVVIPSYNYGHFVGEAVESALSQTYPDIEIIVIDDGSSDDTRDRLASFGSKIRYFYQPNKGLSAARNAGVRLASGEWIALLDADDVWHRDKTAVQLKSAGRLSGVGLIGSMPAIALPDELPPDPLVRDLSVRDFLVSSRTGPSGTLIRAECFTAVGFFDETLRSVEDRDMWLRISARFRTAQVSSPCWWYRPHEGQMSRRASRMLENYEAVLKKFFNEHPEHASLRRLAWSYMYVDGAWSFIDEGQVSVARQLIIKSLLLRPWSFRDDQIRSFSRLRILSRLLLGERVFSSIKKGRTSREALPRG